MPAYTQAIIDIAVMEERSRYEVKVVPSNLLYYLNKD